ncbi:MAG: hypothetical protein LBS54_06445 [Dysgonamonadaceae bacterium]|nr:hypothetical protein [Dysgonamonadaceae bacterium]
MKARLFFLAILSVAMTACTISREAGVQANMAIYSSIPLAPNVVLTVENPIYTSPGPGYVWLDGYWTWDARYREYIWVQGRWEIVPYAGAFWIPGYWDYVSGGYRWIDACWLPRNYDIRYGYYSGRYDYYGRPVYYHRPKVDTHAGFAYGYDHRQSSRGKGYSSSRSFNDEPRDVRSRETKEFYRSSGTERRENNTNRSSQNTIRIREDNPRSPAMESGAGSRSSSSAVENSGRQGSSATPSRSSGAGTVSNPSGSSESNTSRSSGNEQSSGTVSSPSRSSSAGSVSTPSRSSSSGSSTSRSSGSEQSSGTVSSPSRSSSAGSVSTPSRSSSSGSSTSRSSSGGGRR